MSPQELPNPDLERAAGGSLVESANEAATANHSIWKSICLNPRVIFVAFFTSLGGFVFGYQRGVLGQSLVMARFIHNFPSVANSSSATGWLTSVLQLGGIIGSLTAGVLGEVASRKHTMFISCCWIMLGSYLYIGAQAGRPTLLYAGRFFTGLGVGLFSGVGPLYNAELSAPKMRGFIVSFYQFTTALGIMVSFWVGYCSNFIGGTDQNQSDLAWRLPSIIQGIPAVVLAVGIWFMPFSPRWLAKVGRDEEAKRTLAWIRSLPAEHELVLVEYLEIKAEVAFEQKVFAVEFPGLAEKERNAWTEQLAQYATCFRSVNNLKRVGTAWLIMFWQQWTGIDAVIYYASSVFMSFGLTSSTIALLATGVTGVVFLVSTVPAMLIIDKVGRKPLLIVGSGMMCATMVIVGIIVAKFSHNWPAHVEAGWSAVCLIWLYIAAFAATSGPVSWVVVSEIFPLSIRAKGASIGAFSNWLNNFAIAFFVPPMLEAWRWGTYFLFAGFVIAGAVWVWIFLPETKNMSLEEMDRVFASRNGERDIRLLSEAQMEVGLTAFLSQREVKPENNDRTSDPCREVCS
ncbi:general substrate transporter [Thozetella sp. PMI_491]|nr:general substrate transporter [Thozetella sp. PMI_491]